MTVIASFDIGIKNLAYCIMEYQPENVPGQQFKIYDWNVIDLLQTDQTDQKTKKVSKQCQHGTCQHPAYYQFKELHLCRTHSRGYPQNEVSRFYRVDNVSMSELACLTINTLDKIDFSRANEVIFESQPKINPKMKNLSMMLFNYFVTRYMVDKKLMKDVKFISSKNKLKVYDGPFIECDLKNQYSRNKFYGKHYCQYLIRNDPEHLNFFKTFKKRDDLADCFLQGAWYVMSQFKPSRQTKPQLRKMIKISKGDLKINIDSLPRPPMVADPESEPPMVADPESEPPMVADPESEPPMVADPNPESEPQPGPEPQSDPKPKIRITLGDLKQKPQHLIAGRQILKNIQNSQTTHQTHIATNINKYRSMKAYKPRKGARITMSGIKYLIGHGQSPTQLKSSICYYFGDLETFQSKCIN